MHDFTVIPEKDVDVILVSHNCNGRIIVDGVIRNLFLPRPLVVEPKDFDNAAIGIAVVQEQYVPLGVAQRDSKVASLGARTSSAEFLGYVVDSILSASRIDYVAIPGSPLTCRVLHIVVVDVLSTLVLEEHQGVAVNNTRGQL